MNDISIVSVSQNLAARPNGPDSRIDAFPSTRGLTLDEIIDATMFEAASAPGPAPAYALVDSQAHLSPPIPILIPNHQMTEAETTHISGQTPTSWPGYTQEAENGLALLAAEYTAPFPFSFSDQSPLNSQRRAEMTAIWEQIAPFHEYDIPCNASAPAPNLSMEPITETQIPIAPDALRAFRAEFGDTTNMSSSGVQADADRSDAMYLDVMGPAQSSGTNHHSNLDPLSVLANGHQQCGIAIHDPNRGAKSSCAKEEDSVDAECRAAVARLDEDQFNALAANLDSFSFIIDASPLHGDGDGGGIDASDGKANANVNVNVNANTKADAISDSNSDSDVDTSLIPPLKTKDAIMTMCKPKDRFKIANSRPWSKAQDKMHRLSMVWKDGTWVPPFLLSQRERQEYGVGGDLQRVKDVAANVKEARSLQREPLRQARAPPSRQSQSQSQTQTQTLQSRTRSTDEYGRERSSTPPRRQRERGVFQSRGRISNPNPTPTPSALPFDPPLAGMPRGPMRTNSAELDKIAKRRQRERRREHEKRKQKKELEQERELQHDEQKEERRRTVEGKVARGMDKHDDQRQFSKGWSSEAGGSKMISTRHRFSDEKGTRQDVRLRVEDKRDQRRAEVRLVKGQQGESSSNTKCCPTCKRRFSDGMRDGSSEARSFVLSDLSSD